MLARFIHYFIPILLAISSRHAFAQGQDSTIVERDRQVITTLLVGVWNNNNQSYFDRRVKTPDEDSHGRLHVEVDPADDAGSATGPLVLRLKWGNAETDNVSWSLAFADGADAVEMTVRKSNSRADAPTCLVLWRREAAQFRGNTVGGAGCTQLPATWIVSEQQLWLSPLVPPDVAAPASAYKLHRTRAFECYVDIPGVGGGRDEPFERYGPFPMHDGGAMHRFSPNDEPKRELAVSLWRVDWPINNYEGVFTRDVLVLSVLEFLPDGTAQDHGYTFTESDVSRLGVNLKWLLASCYTKSNADQVPFM